MKENNQLDVLNDFELWEPETQPDILGRDGSFGNIEWDYEAFIENIYEPLRNKYPEYVTRRSIGFDTSGEHEMFAYEFTPQKYIKTVYLQSGVHAIETDAYFGLARLLTMIADGVDERLRYIRDNVRLLVVPVVSVFGITARGDYQQIMSKNRYYYLHNSAEVNANRDYEERKARETDNVFNYIAEYRDDVCFAFDCHSTTDVVLGAYLLPMSDGMPEKLLDDHKAINNALYEKHPTNIYKGYMGEEKDYPNPKPLTDTYNYGITKSFGIFGITTEHNDYIYDTVLGTSLTVTLSVELIGNHLLMVCEGSEYNEKLRLGQPIDRYMSGYSGESVRISDR